MVQNRKRREREREGSRPERSLQKHRPTSGSSPFILYFFFLFFFFFLPFRKRNPSRYPIKHGLSFVVVEISKITVGDQLSFDLEIYVKQTSFLIFSLLKLLVPIWTREKKRKRFRSDISLDETKFRAIDRSIRFSRRNEKSHKLSYERDERSEKKKNRRKISSNLRDTHRHDLPTVQYTPFTFPVNRSTEKNVSALADIASQTTRQRPSKKEDILPFLSDSNTFINSDLGKSPEKDGATTRPRRKSKV